MSVLKIVQYPDPVLSSVALPVTDFNDQLKQLVNDMAQTMYAAPGVGLAANQVGVLKKVVVIDISEEKNQLKVLINPQIIEASGEEILYEEGCLSLAGLYEKVKRPNHVRVRAQNINGEYFEYEADGLLAICSQHEIDHLSGTVFIDHLSRLKKDRACVKLRKIKQESKKEI